MAHVCLDCGAFFDRHVPVCTACFTFGRVVVRAERARALVDYQPEVASARDIARTSWGEVSVRTYPTLKLGPKALVVAVGEAGSGKSTFTARALDGICGPVLLVSVEESIGPSLAARLRRAGVKRADFGVASACSVDQIVELTRRYDARAIGIDSVQPSAFAAARELRHLAAVLPKLELVVAVSQVNKHGRIAGTNDLEHECDVLVRCEKLPNDGLTWRLEKSRYQACDDEHARGRILPRVPEALPEPEEVANHA